jgi:hypothetical protein
MVKTRKRTPSILAKQMYGVDVQFDRATSNALSNPVKHVNKKNDLCNDNKCVNVELKRDGFGQLPRRLMPQFNSVEDVRTLLNKINKRFDMNVKGKFVIVHIKDLSPTQSEINNLTVNHILTKWKSNILTQATKTPIIVSENDSVIDGHHRSEALKKAIQMKSLNKMDKIRVFKIDMPAWNILSMANLFKYNKNSQSF